MRLSQTITRIARKRSEPTVRRKLRRSSGNICCGFSLPVQETQQTTELTWEKKFYLGQKIRKYADRLGHQGVSNRPEINPIGEYAEDVAERLYGFLDATNLESFTAAVDAVFDLIEFSEEQGYKTGYSRCRSDYEEKAQKQEPKSLFNIF